LGLLVTRRLEEVKLRLLLKEDEDALVAPTKQVVVVLVPLHETTAFAAADATIEEGEQKCCLASLAVLWSVVVRARLKLRTVPMLLPVDRRCVAVAKTAVVTER